MNKTIRFLLLAGFLLLSLHLFAQGNDKFSASEQQQISVPTPGLFQRSNAFSINFHSLKSSEYSFPLPVGKAVLVDNNQALEITTQKGDAVKCMFDGVVRLSREIGLYGKVVVVRHDNGLETVYAQNAQNLVKVGDRVKAGQTIAIVGGNKERSFLHFTIMVNGSRINPEIILGIRSHKLHKQIVTCTRAGRHVNITTLGKPKDDVKEKRPGLDEDVFTENSTYELDLTALKADYWAYPLPGCKVISPYGGARHHSGVDLKTRPNDNVVSAFDGVVVKAGPFAGYGNCIRIRHRYGFETLYSHQSKNLVKVGQKVKAGEVIGLTGRTGRATTEHLHFELYFKGRRLNPAIVFDHSKHELQHVVLVLGKNGSIKKK